MDSMDIVFPRERQKLIEMGAQPISDSEFSGYLELVKDGKRYIFEPVYGKKSPPECVLRREYDV